MICFRLLTLLYFHHAFPLKVAESKIHFSLNFRLKQIINIHESILRWDSDMLHVFFVLNCE